MDVVNEEYFFLKLARREFEPSSASIIHKKLLAKPRHLPENL